MTSPVIAVRDPGEPLRAARRAQAGARLETSVDIVLVTAQHRRHRTRRTRFVDEGVAARGTIVVVFGVGLTADPAAWSTAGRRWSGSRRKTVLGLRVPWLLHP